MRSRVDSPPALRTRSRSGQYVYPLPVRETAAFEHGGLVAHACQQLVHEAGLPDTGRADDVDHAALAPAGRLVEDLAQALQLSFSPDHGRIEPPRESRRPGEDTEQAPRAHGLRLPLQLERLERLDEHRVAHQTVGCLADQDLPGLAAASRR